MYGGQRERVLDREPHILTHCQIDGCIDDAPQQQPQLRPYPVRRARPIGGQSLARIIGKWPSSLIKNEREREKKIYIQSCGLTTLPPPPCHCCQLAANYAASRLRIRPVRAPQNLLKFSNLPSPLAAPLPSLEDTLRTALSLFPSFFLSFFLARCHLLHSRTTCHHMLNSLPVRGV